MAETRIEHIVDRAVAQVLSNHLPQLQSELVQRVLEEVRPQLAGSSSSGGDFSELLKALLAIQDGTTQKEILRALLDGTSGYCGRSALFVVKGGNATGWQGRAFDENAEVKDFALDVSSVMPSQVLQTRTSVTAHTTDMDAKFVSQFGAPIEDHVVLLPLHLKDKVAALVYADGGTEAGGKLDIPALEVLVAATSAWLEVVSLRKQAAKEVSSEPAAGERFEAPTPSAAAPAYSDPFAAHAPKHAAPAPVEEPAAVAEVIVAPAAAGAAAAAAPALDPFAQMSPEDADVHRKAQRFARLLMDEVKLYNQAKVAEGRKQKDLYDRLKEDIEKSRSTFMKRYGNTVAASGDYFNQEVIRSLAEDDASLLGPNFKR